MLVNNKNYRSIWLDEQDDKVKIIDQRKLPFEFEVTTLRDVQETMEAIRDMYVRGAPLIGVTAAFGYALAMREDSSEKNIDSTFKILINARPTAVNLQWALNLIRNKLKKIPAEQRKEQSLSYALEMAENDVKTNRKIGQYGYEIINEIANRKKKGEPVRILTHCNAGWLATVDIGTATAPIYESNKNGINLEVWVDETRPRNQGAYLTTWELQHNNITNTLIVDNAAGYLMSNGLVDLVIVGSDRTTVNGDVCNKIGTYLKALSAYDNKIPFYVALPSSTIDFELTNGDEIPIEHRSQAEVLRMTGPDNQGKLREISLTQQGIKASNPAFDVTPSRLITGLITERGVVAPQFDQIIALK